MVRRLIAAAAVCLLLPLTGARADDKFFDSDGVRLRYTDQGQGEPVILIHGFAVNTELQWVLPGIVKGLVKDYRIITIDNRGHGRSGKPYDPKMYGMAMIEDVLRLMDHLHIKKAHIVGYSMGGFMTLKLLATHPDRFLSATTGGAGASAQVPQALLDELADSLDKGKGIGPLIRWLTPAGQLKPTEEQLKSVNQMFSLFNNQKALAAVIRSLKGLAITADDLKPNRVPLLALVGSLDPLKEGVDELEGHVPHLKVVVIPGADHMNAFARPEFLKSLKDFLAAHAHKEKLHSEVRQPAEPRTNTRQ
jgi:pimeloyl-ACP methyl ester carboxylesterase